MSLHIVILAAGKGKRMHSTLPKVLHQLAGKPMLEWVVHAAERLRPEQIHVIYGHGGDQIRQSMAHLSVNWVLQNEQKGTGHAVHQALPPIPESADVVILSADVPLINANTLQALYDTYRDHQQLTLLTALLANPTGLGRIVRDDFELIRAIIEEKDANESQKEIKEIYSGICCVSARDLARWLPALNNDNAQGEYYLTDIIAMAVAEGQTIHSLKAHDVLEIQGVNDRLQLHDLERVWQQRQAERLLLSGVTLADKSRIDIRGNLQCGQDVFIDVNCVFIGDVVLGNGCRIAPNCVIINSTLDEKVYVFSNSQVEDSLIGQHSHIGPFARLRPGTVLGADCKIGNFVETKNVHFGNHSKASHLSYLGDASLGDDVNVGAGTITCNYDGANKHKTDIGNDVFIGSGTQLVAPVTVGDGATIGAGSTVRKSVPAHELTITESRQRTLHGWKRPEKI